MPYKTFAIALCLLASTSWATWIVKINEKVISTQEFQDYVDVQKYMAGNEEENIQKEADVGKALLAKYIETQLLLIDAQKNNYTLKHKKVQERIEESKKQWLLLFFVNKQIELPNIRATKEEVVSYFSNMQQGQKTQKDYSELSRAEQAQLHQEVQINKYRNIRKEYQKKLEKRYKVRRYKLSQDVVAKIGATSISQKELETFITSRLQVPTSMLKQNAARYEEFKTQAREEVVFETLAAMEMERVKFKTQRIVKIAFKYFQNSILVDIYLKEALFNQIDVSESELEEAFKKNKPLIRQRKWDLEQTEKFLEENIRQQKFKVKFSDFITTKKEESVIKRNPKELQKIR